jgi:hypothetical protein
MPTPDGRIRLTIVPTLGHGACSRGGNDCFGGLARPDSAAGAGALAPAAT